MSKFAIIIPAAGRSSRFGGIEKKPFVSLDGRPVWLRSAELFWSRPDVSRVYLVISPDDRDDFRTRFGHLIMFANAEVVAGGAERFESVANALGKVTDAEFVAVHDAVRPLVLPRHIDAVFDATRQHGAAMLAVPLADTLKRVGENDTITETVPRAGLWQAQTPQAFRRDWLAEAYANRAELGAAITDDAQLVETSGRPVRVVAGTAANFKITTKDDLELAEAVVRARAKPAQEKAVSRGFGDEAEW